MSIETKDHWRAHESAKHHRHAAAGAQMRCGLVLASRAIEIGNGVVAKHANAIRAPWRHIHTRSRCSRCHEEHVLPQDEIPMIGLDFRKALVHAFALSHANDRLEPWMLGRGRYGGPSIALASSNLPAALRLLCPLCVQISMLQVGRPWYCQLAMETRVPILPRDVKKAVELLKRHPARMRSIDELAAACGVTRRTLEKHFRQFTCRTPSQVRREARLDWVRRELLRAQPDGSVTDLAERCGFNHLGRFAAAYKMRYGESPSATLQRRRQALVSGRSEHTIMSPALERPVIAVHPFDLIGTRARAAATIADEISAALLRNCWLAVGSPERARYHLRGKVRDDRAQRLRIMVVLTDLASGRHRGPTGWTASSTTRSRSRTALLAGLLPPSSARCAPLRLIAHATRTRRN
jgi:AraC-like DNA-binding protein